VSIVVILRQEEGGCQVKFAGKMLGKGGGEVTPLFEWVEPLISVRFWLAILGFEDKRSEICEEWR
jgi:hypothetical protein